MKINNIDISTFKAKLMDRNIGSADFEIVNYWVKNSLNPYINENCTHSYKELTFTLDIICSNANELEIIKSNLIKQLRLSTIKFDDIDYEYIGFCSEVPKADYVMTGNEILNVKMYVYCAGSEVAETANRVSSKTISVSGNLNTPAIIEITPSINIIDITVTGLGDPFTVKNLTTGQKVIVNGEDCTITQNGTNKYNDFDGWEFPKLKPGADTITFSRNNCDITIKYKPRYL